MLNQDFFTKQVDLAGEIKHENQSVRSVRLRNINKVFQYYFGRPVKGFKMLVSYLWNTEENTQKPTKLYAELDDFATMLKYFTFAGKEDKIIHYLAGQGINVSLRDPQSLKDNLVFESGRSQKKLDKVWDDVMSGDASEYTPERLFEELIAMALKTTGEIWNQDAEIKQKIAPQVETECKISLPVFSKAVSLKANEISGKEINPTIANILEKNHQMDEVLEKLYPNKE